MEPTHINQLKSILTLDPLMEFWEKNLTPKSPFIQAIFKELKEKIQKIPELQGPTSNADRLKAHIELIYPLLTAIFPGASLEKDIMGAFTPCTFEPFFITPRFKTLFMDRDNAFIAGVQNLLNTQHAQKRIGLYFLILERIHGIKCLHLDYLDIQTIPDPATGLDRYYRIISDFSFVRVRPLSVPPELSADQKETILANLMDIQTLETFIDLTQFEFAGMSIIKAEDVTHRQIIRSLEQELLIHHSVFSSKGLSTIEARLQILFGKKDLTLGMATLSGDKLLCIRNEGPTQTDCLFTNSRHFSMENPQWQEKGRGKNVLRIPDLHHHPVSRDIEHELADANARSMLMAPLVYQDKIIGLLGISTPTPNELGPMDALILEKVIPLFSLALKRGKEDIHKQIQSLIKERCTAVHPSVEWRFQRAAMDHMERIRRGDTHSTMEPIIFKDVIPFYGQTDIRGSSQARNQGIQADLIHQLNLAQRVMETARKVRPWPMLHEYSFRITTLLERLHTQITPGDEQAVYDLLNMEMPETLKGLSGLGPEVAQRMGEYTRALDPESGMVYHKRKKYEKSVSLLNHALSQYLEAQDRLAQSTFPHYFERHQTDGVDYMMYIGASMKKDQHLSQFHVKDLTLWQLMVACGLARQTHKIRSTLPTPLDTCHLILVNQTPLSIRFRYDEKKFDVDGAYDVRHEIIKSRLDKAMVKGTRERLTQPDHIAVVHATPAEGEQIRRHMDFLIALGELTRDVEEITLEDMPDVKGLKAIRVGVHPSPKSQGTG